MSTPLAGQLGIDGSEVNPLAKRVVGVDLSLTGTGLADGESVAETIRPKHITGHERMAFILGEVVRAANDPRVALVVIEGPSFGSTGGSAHERAGLWWLVAHELWALTIPYAVVSPSARAKYATGKGNAQKDDVLAATIRRWPAFTGSDNNAADAWILAAMGRDHLGLPVTAMPDLNRVALAKVAWPAVVPARSPPWPP